MPKLVMTESVQEQIIGALGAGADIVLAASIVGVSRSGLYRFKKLNPEFSQRCDDARRLSDDRVVKSLYDQATQGNITACIFWLKNRQPQDWRDRREVAVETNEQTERRIIFDDGASVEIAEAATVPEESVN